MLAAHKDAPLGIRLIAAAKIIKGVVFCFLTLGVFDLVHKDVGAIALRFVQHLRISPENRGWDGNEVLHQKALDK